MTPLILLVGFLGAGKTTFLKTMLPELSKHGLDPHVIINDYQNARVDAGLLEGLAKEITPISGSCVCCGSRDELLGALEQFEHAPGRVMVLECNGTTDSEELIELLSLEPGLAHFTLPVQVSIIDGKRWQKRFWHNGLERDQARTANFICITRADEISESRLADVEKSLSEIRVTPERTTAQSMAKVIQAISNEAGAATSREITSPEHDHGDHDHDHGHHHHHHDDAHDHHHGHSHSAHHFASMQVALPDVVNQGAMDTLLESLPREVIRAKGLARLDSSPDDYHVFQYVDGGAETQWLPIGRETRIEQPLILFIGPSLPEDALRERVAGLGAA